MKITIKTVLSNNHNLEAKLLLCHILKKPSSFLYSHSDYCLTEQELLEFNQLYQRFLAGEPAAYIVGKKEFWSLEFLVTADVLIPRPETEHIIEYCLEHFSQDNLSIVDLGTGSGAIAVSLKKEKPSWQITATDLSGEALSVARQNAKNQQVAIHFIQSNWFENITNTFDVIISNPPYIAEQDPHLAQLKFEPVQALTAPESGMQDLRILIEQAPQYLNQEGVLILEHGFEQGEQVRALLKKSGFGQIKTQQDLAGLERFTVGRLG